MVTSFTALLYPLAAMFFICGSLVAGLGIVCWTVVRLVRGGGGNGSAPNAEEESRMMQDLYHGLRKMEERVEALETLLLERDGKGRKS
jgi:phage shock protein B